MNINKIQNVLPPNIIDDILALFGESVFSLKNEIDKLCLASGSSKDLSGTLINGSIIGYNAYAYNLGLPYEPPCQALKVLDCEKGITTTKYQIFV